MSATTLRSVPLPAFDEFCEKEESDTREVMRAAGDADGEAAVRRAYDRANPFAYLRLIAEFLGHVDARISEDRSLYDTRVHQEVCRVSFRLVALRPALIREVAKRRLSTDRARALCSRLEAYVAEVCYRDVPPEALIGTHEKLRPGHGPRQPFLVGEFCRDVHDLRLEVEALAGIEAENSPAAFPVALVDGTTLRIATIAKGPGSANERANKIFLIDRRAMGWDSPKWAQLLSVTPQAFRQTQFWKNRQRAAE